MHLLLNLRHLKLLLLLHLYLFYLLRFNWIWSCNSLRWNCAIWPLLLLNWRRSLFLTTFSAQPSFSRRSHCFTFKDSHGFHWARTRFEMVIDAVFFDDFLLTELHLLIWRMGCRQIVVALLIGVVIRLRYHFSAFERLNSFNSSLRSILKNLKGLDLLLALLFREDFVITI